MDNFLIELIRSYQITGERVTEEVTQWNVDTLSAYEEMLAEGVLLYSEVQEFIGEISGIKQAG